MGSVEFLWAWSDDVRSRLARFGFLELAFWSLSGEPGALEESRWGHDVLHGQEVSSFTVGRWRRGRPVVKGSNACTHQDLVSMRIDPSPEVCRYCFCLGRIWCRCSAACYTVVE